MTHYCMYMLRYLSEVHADLLQIRGDVFKYVGTDNKSEYTALEDSINSSFKSLKDSLQKYKDTHITEDNK
ncbi:MAG TPA: MCP four helix bundle domain-containing protein, partial [Negativicutes bacterium]|nr:MCP four helix bundle domain-containing protein [Negativicutes bacterium]